MGGNAANDNDYRNTEQGGNKNDMTIIFLAVKRSKHHLLLKVRTPSRKSYKGKKEKKKKKRKKIKPRLKKNVDSNKRRILLARIER